ncbi:hypothetical protein CHISP_1114 [Chitinispirillum alkaliphilum]|nr:hypothetical protein CHISP_1114 [Chitinispirillum alkaliphilum]
MRKVYFDDVYQIHILLYIVISLTSLFLVLKLCERLGVGERKTGYLIASFFCIYSLVPFFDLLFDFFPVLPDSGTYSAIIRGEEFEWLPRGYAGFSRIVTFTGTAIIAARSPFVFISLQIFLYFVSVIQIWKSWLYASDDTKVSGSIARIYFTLAFMYPASLLYTTVPLRESFFLFLFSLFLLGYFKISHNRGGLWLLLTGLSGLIILRPSFGAIVIALMGLKYVKADLESILKLSVLGTLALIASLHFFEQINYSISVAWIDYVRNMRFEEYTSGLTYGGVAWGGVTDVISDIPVLTAQFLFSPLPIVSEADPFSMKTALIDCVFIIAVLLIFLVFGLKQFRGLLLWFGFMTILLIASAVWEFYLTGAVRHRMPVVMMLLPPASKAVCSFLLFFRVAKRGCSV